MVERTTGYTMLVQLPDGYRPQHVRDALAEKINSIPDVLSSSLTRDQGPQLRDRKHVSVDADIEIYFCDPHAPRQRATNENTNGLLRQYFPNGTDLSPTAPPTWTGSPPNSTTGPRKRLGFSKPIEEIGPLLTRLTARIRRSPCETGGLGRGGLDDGQRAGWFENGIAEVSVRALPPRTAMCGSRARRMSSSVTGGGASRSLQARAAIPLVRRRE